MFHLICIYSFGILGPLLGEGWVLCSLIFGDLQESSLL
jgi:hypothetical protein